MGAPRSGLDSYATWLCHKGVPCSHKMVYQLGVEDPPDWGDRRAEASWLAVPFLPDAGRVILLVRHPLLCAASLLQITGPIREWARRKIEFYHPDLVSDSVQWWTAWNRRALQYADEVLFLGDLAQQQDFPHCNVWAPPPRLDWSQVDSGVASEARSLWSRI